MHTCSNSRVLPVHCQSIPSHAILPCTFTTSQMLSYGCTRLEVGVQSVYEDVARDTNRGHTVRAVSESFQLAKDAGFKVVAHMMPDLPNVGLERDIEGFIVSLLMNTLLMVSPFFLFHVSRSFSRTRRFERMDSRSTPPLSFVEQVYFAFFFFCKSVR